MKGCKKYRELKFLVAEGTASSRQIAFVENHESRCDDCRAEMSTFVGALNLLRNAQFEPTTSPTFESRLLRRWHVEVRNRRVTFWLPVMAGAFAAAFALLAVLQILLAGPVADPLDLEGHEANMSSSSQPSIPAFQETSDSLPTQ